MRLRQLGRGHRVHFWAPHEVCVGLAAHGGVTPTAVLAWALANTIRATEDAVLVWTSQGLVHTRKESGRTVLKPREAAQLCTLKEKHALDDMYGEPRVLRKVEHVAPELADGWRKHLGGEGGLSPTDLDAVLARFTARSNVIVKYASAIAGPAVVNSADLAEECERLKHVVGVFAVGPHDEVQREAHGQHEHCGRQLRGRAAQTQKARAEAYEHGLAHEHE